MLGAVANGEEVEKELWLTLDVAKGIAILAVVFYHVTKDWFGWQGVHVFIVLSGFGLALSALNHSNATAWGDWFRRRAFRLLPAYWVTVVGGFMLFLASLWLEGTLSGQFRQAVTQFGLDLTLLRNILPSTMFGEPNASLWYVPLLCGLYLVFPLWFAWIRGCSSWRALAGVVLAACLIEVAYRIVAVFHLDGSPVGYGSSFFFGVGRQRVHPMQHLPASYPFSGIAPFGLFVSRIGEFVLGMAGAAALRLSPARFRRIVFGPVGLFAGALTWIAGILCVTASRWTWSIADLLIAAGLTLLLIRASAALSVILPRPAKAVGSIGRASYYLYLAHMPPLIAFSHAYSLWSGHPVAMVVAAIVTLTGIVAASLALQSLDAGVKTAMSRQPGNRREILAG